MLRLLRTSSSWRSISMNNTLPNSSPASSISSRTISSAPTPTPTPLQKRTILAKLKSTADSCDDVLRKIEKEGGFQISRPDLNRWIALFEKRGQIQKSIEIDAFKEWKYVGLMKTYKPCFGRTNVGDPLPTSSLASSNSSTSSSTDANFFGKDSLKNAAAIIAPSSVNLTRYKGLFGSGVVFSEQGLIITTAHTVVDVEKLQVSPVYHAQRKEVMITTSLGQTFVGAVADYDLDYDLALVKIESPVSLSPAKFGTSSLLAVGDFVLSVGNPILYATFSMGIISCLKRPQHDLRLEGKCKVYLQTDCWLHEGSSGGALVNLEGEVIGLNCGHGVGVGFAIPIGTVLKVMKERRWLCED